MSDADDIAGFEAHATMDPDESDAPETDSASDAEATDSSDTETVQGAEVVALEAAQPEPEPEPEPTPALDSPDAALVEAVSGGLTWIPFACYLGLWIMLAGLSAYFLYGASTDQPARWMPEYVPLLWSGVGLTALGPILSVAVWLVARARRPKTARRGLFASAMTRGALVAFFGVAIWVATLFVLEIVAVGGTL